MVLPEWKEVSEKVDCGEELDPVEKFIYENEPADASECGVGDRSKEWREMLRAALEFV